MSDNGTLADDGHMDREVHLAFLGCPTKDCKPPADPETSPPADKRPDDATLWSNASSWIGTEKGHGGNYGDGKYGPPKTANAVVKIKAGVCRLRLILRRILFDPYITYITFVWFFK